MFAAEMERVDKLIESLSESDAGLIPKLTMHLVGSGGKRLRPVLTILAAKLCKYEGERHIRLAAAIEFIHTATLLHDDVVDESELRRGKQTANHVWGNAASVLVGDFLLSRAFQLMAQDGSLKVLQILSDTSAIISEGEVLQLMSMGDLAREKETYIRIISAKTAQLFAAGCEVGAVIADAGDAKENAMLEFGKNLGIAFQIVDDALDYSAKQEQLGKAVGDDFREGKVTLPVLNAYAKADKQGKTFWERTISAHKQEEGDLAEAIRLIGATNALDATMAEAKAYADKAAKALEVFDDSDAKQALLDLLEFSVNRPY
ncbi:MAG: polyprenyl synthetase family protein [Proteobacteria bacterium]|nr:polyprenyl synthetase family protein [Pseudomonadota bacterium]